MLRLDRYSIGVGDRFAHQAKAQLRACVLAGEAGVDVIPVWNKSNREHMIIGSDPCSVREAADEAVRSLGWKKPYHVDADHINLDTVDRYIAASDFFTIDVAAFIGKPAERSDVTQFLARHSGAGNGFRGGADSRKVSRQRFRKPGVFTGASPQPGAQERLSRKSPWMKPTLRRRRRSC